PLQPAPGQEPRKTAPHAVGCNRAAALGDVAQQCCELAPLNGAERQSVQRFAVAEQMALDLVIAPGLHAHGPVLARLRALIGRILWQQRLEREIGFGLRLDDIVRRVLSELDARVPCLGGLARLGEIDRVHCSEVLAPMFVAELVLKYERSSLAADAQSEAR